MQNDIKELIEDSYNIVIVIDSFCQNNCDNFEISNIAPLVKIIRSNLDKCNEELSSADVD